MVGERFEGVTHFANKLNQQIASQRTARFDIELCREQPLVWQL
jgi:hypothetical protein